MCIPEPERWNNVKDLGKTKVAENDGRDVPFSPGCVMRQMIGHSMATRERAGKSETFAKGKGRRQNPVGRDGEIMKYPQVLPNGTIGGSRNSKRDVHTARQRAGEGSASFGVRGYTDSGPIGNLIGVVSAAVQVAPP